MNIKSNVLSASILTAISTAVLAVPQPAYQPPVVPSMYDGGPASPLIASTDLSMAERTAYANYEAILQITEATIHATSCTAIAGTYSVTAFSDGSIATPGQNFATVVSPGGSFTVASNSAPLPLPPNDGRGQLISVNSIGGALNGRAVGTYHADLAFNGVNNMMDSTSYVDVQGANGRPDRYYGKVIKDFFRGALLAGTTGLHTVTYPDGTSAQVDEYYNIYDWGLQSLDKLGYPVNKYWQRSKSHRDDGTNGRTLFVKDRLVGFGTCRIIIDTKGINGQDIFQQSGSLTVQTGVTPGAAVTYPPSNADQFTTYPF